jgi:hypothetical protein
MGGDQQFSVRQVAGELARAVAGGVAEDQPPGIEALELEPAHLEVGAEGLEAPRPALAVPGGLGLGLVADLRGVASHLRGEAVVRQGAGLEPPGPPEHVVPVPVREEQRHLGRSDFAHRPREVVQLRGQHARVHHHRVPRVQQQHRVHLERRAPANVNAVAEIGPRGVGGAHGRTVEPSTATAPR